MGSECRRWEWALGGVPSPQGPSVVSSSFRLPQEGLVGLPAEGEEDVEAGLLGPPSVGSGREGM